MEDYLYLDDDINFYSNKYKKLLIIKPFKDTLKYGHIINRSKFIKKFNSELKKNKFGNSIFNKRLKIIINSTFTEEDKNITIIHFLIFIILIIQVK